MRSLEVAQERPPDTVGITIVGGSLSLGCGVAAEETHADRIQQRLRTLEEGGTRCGILSFGIGNFDSVQVLALCREMVAKFQPGFPRKARRRRPGRPRPH